MCRRWVLNCEYPASLAYVCAGEGKSTFEYYDFGVKTLFESIALGSFLPGIVVVWRAGEWLAGLWIWMDGVDAYSRLRGEYSFDNGGTRYLKYIRLYAFSLACM